MNKEELLRLMERITDRTATEAEIAQYNHWCDGFRMREVAVPNMEEIKAGMLNHIHQYMDHEQEVSEPVVRRIRFGYVAAIAAAVATVVFGIWFYEVAPSRNASRKDVAYSNDAAPGKNTATLTLANGKVIRLSDAKTGVVVGSDNVTYNDGSSITSSSLRGGMTKQSPDEVAASQSAPRNDGQEGENKVQTLTAATPRGGTYQVTLPDGTHVWLNADSKLTFPSNFENAKQRIVKLEGEAYFAVVHNARQPFKVESNGQVVEDIGTEFNINAYADELSVKTTLVAGSARVKAEDKSIVLKPDQQSISKSGAIKVVKVDANDAIDWKNGDFIFKKESLASIMKRVARWYNVQVIYDQDVDQEEAFGGKVSRSKNISAVLKIMQSTGQIKFKISGDRVTVSK